MRGLRCGREPRPMCPIRRRATMQVVEVHKGQSGCWHGRRAGRVEGGERRQGVVLPAAPDLGARRRSTYRTTITSGCGPLDRQSRLELVGHLGILHEQLRGEVIQREDLHAEGVGLLWCYISREFECYGNNTPSRAAGRGTERAGRRSRHKTPTAARRRTRGSENLSFRPQADRARRAAMQVWHGQERPRPKLGIIAAQNARCVRCFRRRFSRRATPSVC